MPVYQLDERLVFPPVHQAEQNGLLAIGGDLSAQRLLLAYSQGIFPWYEHNLPILWHCPDPRMVLLSQNVHVPRKLAKIMRQQTYEVRLDTAFSQVIDRCASIRRPGQNNTWITKEMKRAYIQLHELGYAHSAETWHKGTLIGGLYGVSLGAAYFGESMFSDVTNASKIAFVTLTRQLTRWNISLIDCQVYTHHLAQFGATLWPREQFLTALENALKSSTMRGKWQLDPRFREV